MDVQATNNTPAAPSQSQTSQAVLGQDIQAFLTLLTTQLQNQDPLSPMDTNEYTNQLIGFSQVEQQILMNEKMEVMLEQDAGSLITQASEMVGRLVEVPGSIGELEEGRLIGFIYDMPQNSYSTQVNVYDSQNRLVFSAPGETNGGEHGFAWDGTDSAGGTQPPGLYRMQVIALDEFNEPITGIETSVISRVRGAQVDQGEIQLEIGNGLIPLDRVRTILDG